MKNGMNKKDFNDEFSIKDMVYLDDDIFKGVGYPHNWRCKCGNTFKKRYSDMRRYDECCRKCYERRMDERYKYEVEKNGDYEYIKTFRTGEYLEDGRKCSVPYIKIRHNMCGNIYNIQAAQFINRNIRCNKCCGSYEKSFAYHIEVGLGEPIEKYWDFEKNVLNPYHISKSMNAKNKNGDNLMVWIKCQEKDYHESYQVSCNAFVRKGGCPYCNTSASKKFHVIDSFGAIHFDKVQSWHPDNDISPFKVSKGTKKKFKFICGKCNEVFKRSVEGAARYGVECIKCSSSKGEMKIGEVLNKMNIKFEPQKKYRDLIGVGGGLLSYDFYLPDYNLLIEYQGEFHDGTARRQAQEEHKVQQEHDRRKREYARNNNIDILEIWYWDFNDIKNILKNKLT